MAAAFHARIDALLGDEPSSRPAPVALRGLGPLGAGRVMGMVGDPYEGASMRSRELASWNPNTQSADNEILPIKLRSDARARDMGRNDAYVQNGANLHRDNIVGSMYLLNSKPSSVTLFGTQDDAWEEAYQAEIEEKFTLWAESANNWPDASRMNNFTGLVRLAVATQTYSGEMLATVEWLRDGGASRPFNTAIQMVDTDRLSTPFDLMSDKWVRGGVRRNGYGAPQGYYIRDAHPTDWQMSPDTMTWTYVPIRKPWGRLQVLHFFEQQRPDQTRAIAQMVAALKEMKMTKNFRDIVLQNAVVNSMYAASIESDLPTEAIFARLGGTDFTPDALQEALTAYITGHFATISEFSGGSKNLQIDGVRIPHLPPGSKLQLRPANTSGAPLGTEFEMSLLRHIAAALNVSYEQLSKDYSNTNYSSARAAMTETWKSMLSMKKMGADRFASAVFRLWLEESINGGMIEAVKRANMPSWYDGLNADALSACDWVGASRGQIDELKETQAAVLRVSSGLGTLEGELARLGLDWRKVLRQLAREDKLKKTYDILQAPNPTQNQQNATTGTPKDKTNPKKTGAEFEDLEGEL